MNEDELPRTIVADPPWDYGSAEVLGAGMNSKGVRPGSNSVKRYGSMKHEELCAMKPAAADNAHLYMWTTNQFLVQAHDICKAWGFKPKTVLTWTKVRKDDRSRVSMKMGYYFRGATEHCVFAVRGSQPLVSERAQPTGFLWPRLPHSVKPDAFYDLVEECSSGPYLELFSRRARLGWNVWGNQSLEGGEA